jgi:hypothetical protein
MHAAIRRYESVDPGHTDEAIKTVNSGLVPLLSKLPEAQADESSRVAASWVIEAKIDEMIREAPEITSGRVVARADRELATA